MPSTEMVHLTVRAKGGRAPQWQTDDEQAEDISLSGLKHIHYSVWWLSSWCENRSIQSEAAVPLAFQIVGRVQQMKAFVVRLGCQSHSKRCSSSLVVCPQNSSMSSDLISMTWNPWSFHALPTWSPLSSETYGVSHRARSPCWAISRKSQVHNGNWPGVTGWQSDDWAKLASKHGTHAHTSRTKAQENWGGRNNTLLLFLWHICLG